MVSQTYKPVLMFIHFAIIYIFFTLNVSGQDNEPDPPKGYWSMTTLKLAYVLGRLDLIDEHPAVPDDLIYHKNVIYKIVDGDTLMLDICYQEKTQGSKPLLVFIYGEAWKHGGKDKYLGYLIDYARKGYITCSVWYRTSRVAKFPAAIEDVKCAVKWLVANSAKYHIDTGRIALQGGSTGAYLALMTAYTFGSSHFEDTCLDGVSDPRIRAVIDLYSPVDLTDEYVVEKTKAEQFIGTPWSADPGAYPKASPVNYVTPNAPPTLIFHGTIDDIVPVEQSELLKAKLDEIGVPVEYHELKGWPHFMESGKKVNNYCQYYIDRFLKKHLK